MHAGIGIALALAAPSGFDDAFTGKTLRLDYFHSGTAADEQISLDQVRLEGDWPGSRTHLLDDTNLGKYLFVIVDSATNQPLYSRGFASVFGEWETTGEAKKMSRTYHESLRFPEPKKPFQVVLEKRRGDGAFREVYTTLVDPASRFVNRSPITPRGKVFSIFENGAPAKKVDLLVLGEGYTSAEANKFRDDATKLVGALFDTEPYKTHRNDFNVRAIHVPSAQSGISNPRKGVWRDSPLGLSFNAFDSDRYVLTFANAAMRDAAAQAPYDALIIVFNDRKYGGGGIFNLYATCASDTEPAPYVFVHEFGHSFAGLADEYYTSQVSYEAFTPEGSEPWEPNVTALLDPKHPKWGDLVEPGTPIPTPWNQASFDRASLEYQAKREQMIEAQAPEEAMEALFREVKQVTAPMLREEKFFGRTGAFEGAAYQAKGLYRPEADCIMFTRNPTTFCRVCSRAIERVIHLYAE
jgi:IgA peptidase M64/peptidase M64-like protein